MPPTKAPTIIQNVYTAQALIKGNPFTFPDKFPKGPGYYELLVAIYVTFTNTTGTTPLTDALKKFIKNVNFKSDKEGVIINACGVELWDRAEKCGGSLSFQDTLAATAGTYSIFFPIHFASPIMRRPEDTLVDSRRTTQFDLSISCGDVADLLSSVGDSAITAITADISVVQSVGPVNASNRPKAVPYVMNVGPFDPATFTAIDIERNVDLAINDLTVYTCNSATAGVPCSGTLADTVLKSLQFEDNFAIPFRAVPWRQLTVKNKIDYQYSAKHVGSAQIDFTMDGSIYSAYPTGGKSRCQITWVTQTLSTSGVTALIDGWKTLKA